MLKFNNIINNLQQPEPTIVKEAEKIQEMIYFISTTDLLDSYTTAEIITNTLKNNLVLYNEKWYMLDLNTNL